MKNKSLTTTLIYIVIKEKVLTMDIKTDTGDVVCSSPAAGDMEISTSTGNITLKELNDTGMPDLEANRELLKHCMAEE